MNKKDRTLILVESPEKSKTISKIFRDEGYNNVVVLATIGHFTKLKDGEGYYNTGIHPEDNFKMDFICDKDKADNIKKLKEQVKMADTIYICSDPDREGEAIAWSCIKFLNIPKAKYKRAVYHAINKKDIFDGIENASDINQDLVNAAHTRSCIDKGIGYRLSNVAKTNVNAKSVGRVQSAALKMIVAREEEILNFKPENYFDLFLKFIKNNTEFKAKYIGTPTHNVKRLNSQEEIDTIFNDCKGHNFIVKEIEFKDKKENPKAPFSTATFQQECSNKLGLTVKQSQDCAQKLFDSGKISYHRTDDEEFSEEFEKELKDFVLKTYGKDYASGTVTRGKKDENAQEAHEGLHVLDLSLTPEKFAKESGSELLTKVYKIIYNRTVACALKPTIIAETKYTISNNNLHQFVLVSHELKFDGYKIVYNYKDDEDDKEDLVKETFTKDEVLQSCSFESIPKQTQPPSRYKEASFVKEMKEVGIGRPSTYASTIETIKSESRGYCVVEDKCLKPTQLGMDLSHFLDKSFPDIINIDYTREMEKDLDLIANGKVKHLDFLKTFFERLEESASKVSPSEISRTCPECGKPLVKRKGKYGFFLGCSGYPNCKHMEKI